MPKQFERPEALDLTEETVSADSQGNITDQGSAERAREPHNPDRFPKETDEFIEMAEQKRQEILAEIRSELSVLTDPDKELLGDISPKTLKDFKEEIYTTGEEWINRLNENPDENLKGFAEDLEELRRGFVEQLIADSTTDVLEHFKSKLETAVNGPKTREIMRERFRNIVSGALEKYIQSGAPRDFKEVSVNLQTANYSINGMQRQYIVGIVIKIEKYGPARNESEPKSPNDQVGVS